MVIQLTRHAFTRLCRFFVAPLSRAQALDWLYAQFNAAQRVTIATTRHTTRQGYLCITPTCRIAYERLVVRGQVVLRVRTVMYGGFRGEAYLRYRRDQVDWYHVMQVRFAGEVETHLSLGLWAEEPACGLIATPVSFTLVPGERPPAGACSQCMQMYHTWLHHRHTKRKALRKQLRTATRHGQSYTLPSFPHAQDALMG